MKRLLLCLVLSLCGACATLSTTPRAPTLAELRRAAEARVSDPLAWRDLALAELFTAGGDVARAEKALAHAHKLDPKSLEVLYAQALLSDVHGHPAQALEAYLATLELAARSSSPRAQAILESATYGVQGQSGMVRGYIQQTEPRVAKLIAQPGLSLASRAALADVLFPIVSRRGDVTRLLQLAGQLGCAAEFRVAGPFGPRELLGFDGPPPADLSKPLLERYDLGASRGLRPTRSTRAQGCRVQLGGGEVAEGGTTLAETTLQLSAAGEYMVRLDTPNTAELFVDGQSVLRVDRRQVLGARVMFTKLTLAAGTHRLVARVSSRHPSPVLQFAIAPFVAADTTALQLPAARTKQPDLDLYLRAAIALARGDVLGARQLLATSASARLASPLLQLQRAGVALTDPLLPDGVRGDDARRYLSGALARDGALWAPVVQLASLAAKAGRAKEAITALRKARAQWPEVPAIGLGLVELLRGKGFNAAADRELASVRELVPDACTPMNAELSALRVRQRTPEAYALAKKLVACDAESNVLFTLALERRDFATAKAELDRLRALQLGNGLYATLLAELSLATNMGDEAAVTRVIEQLRARFPRAYTGAIEQIDRQVAAGKKSEALQTLNQALKNETAAMAGLFRVAPALGEAHLLAPYRRDGSAAIKAFEGAGRSYDGPQVLVLDYMAARVFPDGSSLDLVHTVQKAQSAEAVNQLGEVEIPEGAQVLTLRAIKPDGRQLEADNIANKNTVSLPNVAPGDYVELEYLQANSPADGFPLGYLGERFYFKSFEVPFHHSEMVVLLPSEMHYQLDPRGAAPAVKERVVDGLRELVFAVDQSVPLVEEPNSVSAREFIPSIRIGVNATFEAMVDGLRDVLSDRDLYDPYYAAVAKRVVGDAAPHDYALRAQRLYTWLLENIENNNDVFSQAAVMLRAKAGNRARALHYMLRLAGVPAQLALARSFSGDANESALADADTYDHLLVRVDTGKDPLWLFANERWAPFGFLPSSLRGQPALLLSAGAPRVRVSEGLLGADTRHFTVQVALHADGAARIDVTETLHGSEAIGWRGQLEQIPQAELDHRMEQDYVARLFPGASLASLEISGREQAAPDLVLHYVADVKSFARPVTSGLAVPALLPSEISANFARTATRKTTELIATPVQTAVDATIALPDGFALSSAPGPEALVGAFASRPRFSDKVSAEGKQLRLTRSLLLPAARIDPKDYPAFAEFCRRVDEIEGRELLLRMQKN